jgi:UDP-glucose 4-epimerase
MTVLITGGAGYIGSHIAWEFLDHGEPVVIIDNLETGVVENVPKAAAFYQGCVGDKALMTDIINRHSVDAIVHCAGSTVVPESVSDPLKYYLNNVVAPSYMLDVAISLGVKTVVFSSTAAVYGIPQQAKVSETHPLEPTSPYGTSKMMFENILSDSCRAYGITAACLRYFNVAGADPLGRTGQSTPDATHLLKVCAEVALGKRDELIIYGTDYDTADGTCIRDFNHVSDLAAVHVQA